jgi:hypothetical protein
MRMGVNRGGKSWILKSPYFSVKFSWCCLRYSYTGLWGIVCRGSLHLIWTNLSYRLVVYFLVALSAVELYQVSLKLHFLLNDDLPSK